MEEGTRVLMENVLDPDVIQLADGTYRMYLNAENILSAHSTDGITFTPEEGVRVEKGNVPGSILMPDGTVRMYNCIKGISVYESQDGIEFSLLEENIIQKDDQVGRILCDPSITSIPDGYLLVYKVNAGR